jgi:hypothetical protein
MTLATILFVLQLVCLVIAAVRESGDDSRFEGEKLQYRS